MRFILFTLSVVHAFECTLTASSIPYDLSPLAGLRTASVTSETPPTSNEAKAYFNLCGNIGEDEGDDGDKVGHLCCLC